MLQEKFEKFLMDVLWSCSVAQNDLYRTLNGRLDEVWMKSSGVCKTGTDFEIFELFL